MGKKKKQTVGHKYYLGMHLISGLKVVDSVKKIFCGEREAWSGNVTTNQKININKPELFGGQDSEGGIQGDVDIEFGEPTQVANAYLSAKLPGPVPAFRGVLGFVLNRVYIGTSQYVKPWAFECVRMPAKGWYDSTANINDDANPAHIIYECLIDKEYGLGYGPLDIDDAAFRAVALQLYNENFGLSFVWSEEQTIEEFINEVLRHLDATLFVDPASGLFVLRLIRDDYDPNLIPTLNEDNIVKVLEYTRPSLAEATNQIVLAYRDRDSNKDVTVTVQNLALYNVQGFRVSSKIKFAGITNATIANIIAQRELNQLSAPIAKLNLITTRDVLTDVRIGDTFKWSWEAFGVESIIMRVISIGQGSLGDGQIRIEATEDVFSTASAIFAPPPDTEWVPSTNEPQPVTIREVQEAFYAILIAENGVGWVPPSDEYGSIITLAGPPTSDSINYDLHTSNDSGVTYSYSGSGDFLPYFILSGDLEAGSTVLEWTFSSNLQDASIDDILQIDHEFMQITAVDLNNSQVTVSRAVFDTAPVKHLSGSVALISNIQFLGVDERSYVDGDQIRVKLVSRTLQGDLPLNSALTDTVTMTSRFMRPYVAAYMTVNNEYFPSAVVPRDISGSYNIAWRHRDRVLQADSIVGETSPSIGPEVGTTYTLQIFDSDTNSLLRVVDSIVSPQYEYTANMQISDGGSAVSNLRLVLSTRRDTYESFQNFVLEFQGISPSNDPTVLENWLDLDGVTNMSTGYTP